MNLSFSAERAKPLLSEEEIGKAIEDEAARLRQAQEGRLGDGERLGWFSVSASAPEAEVGRMLELADRVRREAKVLIVIGVGGSNRGAKAAIDALRGSIESPTRIAWAGDSLSSASLAECLETVRKESVVLDVIAKDFNTVEPGIAFRMLRAAMVEKYGESWGRRVIVTGSRGKGQLLELAASHGWSALAFPEDIGGRFSVLSAVGLFPMAVAGVDIRRLLEGAAAMEKRLGAADLRENPAARYAVTRNLLAARGFCVESLVTFEPSLEAFARWWIQLFAETEGKCPEAVFPTAFCYSEDLHAVGQYVQQGPRRIGETFLRLFHGSPGLMVSPSPGLRDGFEYLDGAAFDALNQAVYEAALEAHSRDGVPCLEIAFPGSAGVDEGTMGALFYFFMSACYLSAAILGVNPFSQDGVEGYKRNMYRILGKGRP